MYQPRCQNGIYSEYVIYGIICDEFAIFKFFYFIKRILTNILKCIMLETKVGSCITAIPFKKANNLIHGTSPKHRLEKQSETP